MSGVKMMDSFKTWKEFKELYGFWDDEQIYTNCAMLIPVFRVEQWLDQINEIPVRPLPCVRDEHGDIRGQTVKQLFAKIDEELNELKAAVLCTATQYGYISEQCQKIDIVSAGETETEELAEEAADTITAITTLCEALGIGAEMRDEAQRRVNDKNRERGRL
jgi:NTP pyrophosphatase (non-canonical NTP hydrolase)